MVVEDVFVGLAMVGSGVSVGASKMNVLQANDEAAITATIITTRFIAHSTLI